MSTHNLCFREKNVNLSFTIKLHGRVLKHDVNTCARQFNANSVLGSHHAKIPIDAMCSDF